MRVLVEGSCLLVVRITSMLLLLDFFRVFFFLLLLVGSTCSWSCVALVVCPLVCGYGKAPVLLVRWGAGLVVLVDFFEEVFECDSVAVVVVDCFFEGEGV